MVGSSAESLNWLSRYLFLSPSYNLEYSCFVECKFLTNDIVYHLAVSKPYDAQLEEFNLGSKLKVLFVSISIGTRKYFASV